MPSYKHRKRNNKLHQQQSRSQPANHSLQRRTLATPSLNPDNATSDDRELIRERSPLEQSGSLLQRSELNQPESPSCRPVGILPFPIQRQPKEDPLSPTEKLSRGECSSFNWSSVTVQRKPSHANSRFSHMYGQQAAQQQSTSPASHTSDRGNLTIQRRVDASNLGQLVKQQQDLQQDATERQLDPNESYTTVGFEHEFAQMTDGPLRGHDHVQVGGTSEFMPYTGINFKLETDSSNVIEMVSPPFFVETIAQGSSIPIPEDVAKMNRIIATDLQGSLHTEDLTLRDFTHTMSDVAGLNFSLHLKPSISSENKTAESSTPWVWSSLKNQGGWVPTRVFSVPNIHLKPSQKAGGVSAQANVALTGADIGKVLEESGSPTASSNKKIAAFGHMQVEIERELLEAAHYCSDEVSAALMTFIQQLARTLTSIVSVPFQERLLAAQGKMFTEHPKDWWASMGVHASGKGPAWQSKHEQMEFLTSHVKDPQDVWVKDTIMNFGLGLLEPREWTTVKQMLQNEQLSQMLGDIEDNENAMHGLRDAKTYAALFSKNRGIGAQMLAAVSQIQSQIQENDLEQRTDTRDLNLGVTERPQFLSNDPQYTGGRQDTYLPGDKVKLPGTGDRAHVLESRRDLASFLNSLKTIRDREATGAGGASSASSTAQYEILEHLAQRHPVGSFVRYRVFDDINIESLSLEHIDIDCLARVIGYDYDTDDLPMLRVVGLSLVDSESLTIYGRDKNAQKWVGSSDWDQMDADRYVNQIQTIPLDRLMV